MKLSQLLEIQRCFALLRDVEINTNALSPKDYVDCLRAQSMLNVEINELAQTIEIELEAA